MAPAAPLIHGLTSDPASLGLRGPIKHLLTMAWAHNCE